MLVALLVISVTALGACDDHGKDSGKAAAATQTKGEAGSKDAASDSIRLSEDEMRRAGVRTERLDLGDPVETIAAFGTIVPNQNRIAKIVPPIPGRIARIDADLGDRVRAGAQLALLDSAELGEARAAAQQAEAELAVARAAFERTRQLVAEQAMAQKDELRAKADYERAQATAAAAAARLATLGAGGSAGKAASAALAVTAPFAGTVVEKAAVLGEYAQPYQPLFTLADLSTVWVETSIYERDIAEVAVGSLATLTTAAYPGVRFSGRVTYVSSILDRETHTAKARIEVPNADSRLKPGMFADVVLQKATEAEPALRVPEAALVLLQGQMTAFVATPNGFDPRPVETGARGGGLVTVTAGLEAGDEVVVRGAFALKARLLKSQLSDTD